MNQKSIWIKIQGICEAEQVKNDVLEFIKEDSSLAGDITRYEP